MAEAGLIALIESISTQEGSFSMKFVYIALIVLVTAVVLLFKIQNFQMVTLSLFSASVTLPTSLLVIGVYVLGMLTGGCVLSLLRSWTRGALRPVQK
jgi:putative membrane protein